MIANNPLYSDVQINHELLQQLQDQPDISTSIKVIEEKEMNEEKNKEDMEQEHLDKLDMEQNNGPSEHAATTGAAEEDEIDKVEESYLPLPIGDGLFEDKKSTMV